MDENIKKDNKKALPKFLMIMIAAALSGGLLGFFTAFFLREDTVALLSGGIRSWANLLGPWLLPVMICIVLAVNFPVMRSVRRLRASWDGEDDRIPDVIDRKTDGLLVLQNICMGLMYLVYSINVVYNKNLGVLLAIQFLAGIFVTIWMQKRTVDFVRSMNPEKQGSIFDMKFCKKWIDSCDEGQKRIQGEAAIHTLRVMVPACFILWALLLLFQLFAGEGILSSLAVITLFIISQLTNWLQVRRLSAGRQ